MTEVQGAADQRTHPLLLPAAVGMMTGLASTTFLYSRFGGALHDLPAYSLFVLAMAVGGALGGVASVFAGSRLS